MTLTGLLLWLAFAFFTPFAIIAGFILGVLLPIAYVAQLLDREEQRRARVDDAIERLKCP